MTDSKVESKHTPGPWTFDSEDMNVYSQIGSGIATIHRRAKTKGIDDLEKSGLSLETKSNAELIARAPELIKENEELRKENADLMQIHKEHHSELLEIYMRLPDEGTKHNLEAIQTLFSKMVQSIKDYERVS